MTADRQPEATLPPGLALSWGFVPAGRRGPKPGHSVEGILETALALADADGFTAVSLPKIARRLGLTTNALYRYVSSKDELLVLMADAGWGSPPESDAPGWRDAATRWAKAVIDGYCARPWLLDIPVRGAPVTPNLLRWLESFLEGMASSGLGRQELLSCAMLLDGYARSTANLVRDLRDSTSPPVQAEAVSEFLRPLLAERGYPIMAELMSGGDYEDGLGETDVDFGLKRILDGIEVLVTARHRNPS
jgi:AcrR family transcriptional regulator